MFDIGMSELLIVGVVALIVVGPKDLPGMFHTLGRFTAKIKSMGREFSRAMEAAAKEAGVDDIKDGLNAAANPKKFGLDKLKDAASDFENWDPMKTGDAKAPPKPEFDEERAEAARKISESAAAKATKRLAEDAKAEAAPKTSKATPKTAAAKKPAAKKATAKTTAAKKPATAAKSASKTAAAKTSKARTAEKKEGKA